MIIYAIKISDDTIASILNFVKYLFAPNSKTEVHLSIRGPYKDKLSNKKIIEYNGIIKNSIIEIKGIGNFFDYNQNTVFLKCFSSKIQKVWKKTSYGYNPHLTLYDGDDPELAVILHDILMKEAINFSFVASDLILYDTSKLNSSILLTLGINKDVLKPIIGIDWEQIKLPELTLNEKLRLTVECFKYLNKDTHS